MGRRYSKNKYDGKILGFLFLAILGWIVVPFLVIFDLWRARRYKRRLIAILICFFLWMSVLSCAFFVFKEIKKPEHAHVIAFFIVPWIWRILFTPIVNLYAPFFTGRDFYSSQAWLDLRYQVLRDLGRKCMLCGTTDGEMHVDHIKPRSKYPDLALDPSNLQVLCRSCNKGKSNLYADDFRN